MKRWLMITTVDVLARPNNREHQLLSRLSGRFEETTVVFRRRGADAPRWKRLTDAVLPSVQVTFRDGVRYVAVNPPLNHPEGMVREAMARGERSGSSWRTALLRLAAGPVGILKDLSTILCLAAAAGLYGRTGRETFCTAMGPWAAAAARILAGCGRVGSWIYEDRDFEPGFIDSPLRRRWAALMERSGVRAAPATVSIGRRLRTLRVETTGRNPFLIPTGADVSRGPATQTESRAPTLVYIGNVARWSGLVEAVRSLPAIRASVPGARLVVLGDGDPSVIEDLKGEIRASAIADAVDLLPGIPHEQVAGLLANCSLGLAVFEPNALRVHAMPLKVVEYMAAGLPVLATEGTESADVVRHYDCGLAVQPDSASIARAAITILGRQGYRTRLSRNALAASQDFDWERLAAREWALMQRLAALEGKVDADVECEDWHGAAAAPSGN